MWLWDGPVGRLGLQGRETACLAEDGRAKGRVRLEGQTDKASDLTLYNKHFRSEIDIKN